MIADRVAWPSRQERQKPQEGVIYSSNVYQNAPAELRGLAKFLRVLTIEPKTYTYWYKRPYISTGPVVSIVQSEGVKRVLGTVPIEVRRLGGVSRPARHVPALPIARRELPRAANHAELRRRDAGRVPWLPGLPRVAQPRPGTGREWRGPHSFAARHHAATVGARHGQLSALCAAGVGRLLQQVPRGQRRGPQGART